MVSLVEKARIRHLTNGSRSLASATKEFAALIPGTDLIIREMSGKIDAAWQNDWITAGRVPPDGGWNWPDMRKRYQYVSALKVAMWCDGEATLCALMLSRLNNTACVVDFLEGSPAPNHPLKGKVTLFGLDIVARYAQASGRGQVWLNNPANDALIRLYTQVYGFEYVRPKQGSPYCRKAV